jgi:hypothetical protein
MYTQFIRDDIKFKILSNIDFFGKKEVNKDKFFKELKNYDLGVWANNENNPKLTEVEIYTKNGEFLDWENIVLNYMKSLNTFLREQIGVCIDKEISRIIDNELSYLIPQRKGYKDFDDNFFIAIKGEVIFPMISKEYDFKLAVIKLVEWAKRANRDVSVIKI